MSFGARCGFFVLMVGLTAPTLAKDRPAGPWQDPPAREAGTPDTPKAAEPETSKEPVKTETRETAASSQRFAQRSASLERKRASRSAARQRRSRAQRETVQASGYATRRRASPARMTRRLRPAPYAQAAEPFVPYPEAYEEIRPRYPLTQLRSEGWGSLIAARRSRRARSVETRDDIILHSRMFAFPSDRHGDEHGFELEAED